MGAADADMVSSRRMMLVGLRKRWWSEKVVDA
ncbi:hypothetical protein A2U01_0051084, partial [Trifolium medium]|nr:hypothetical protein [Trifolium medium]